MYVWDAVKYAINKKNLKYEQISKRLNKSKHYVSAQLAQKRSPSVQTLDMILRSIGWHLEVVSDDGTERIRLES